MPLTVARSPPLTALQHRVHRHSTAPFGGLTAHCRRLRLPHWCPSDVAIRPVPARQFPVPPNRDPRQRHPVLRLRLQTARGVNVAVSPALDTPHVPAPSLLSLRSPDTLLGSLRSPSPAAEARSTAYQRLPVQSFSESTTMTRLPVKSVPAPVRERRRQTGALIAFATQIGERTDPFRRYKWYLASQRFVPAPDHAWLRCSGWPAPEPGCCGTQRVAERPRVHRLV